MTAFRALAFLCITPIKRYIGNTDYRPFGNEREGYKGVEAVPEINRRQDGKHASRVSGVRRQHRRYPDQPGIVIQGIERHGILDVANSPPSATNGATAGCTPQRIEQRRCEIDPALQPPGGSRPTQQLSQFPKARHGSVGNENGGKAMQLAPDYRTRGGYDLARTGDRPRYVPHANGMLTAKFGPDVVRQRNASIGALPWI
jgi:hypothetical protein